MRHSPDNRKRHQDDEAGSGQHAGRLPANHTVRVEHNLSTSSPYLVPSFRSRSRRLLHQRVHYSSGPIILLWDEIDERLPSTDEGQIYENGLTHSDEDDTDQDI